MYEIDWSRGNGSSPYTFAEEADIKAPITEKVEGIEDEDAVLLEADNYEDPEEAEADIAEELDEEIDESEAE